MWQTVSAKEVGSSSSNSNSGSDPKLIMVSTGVYQQADDSVFVRGSKREGKSANDGLGPLCPLVRKEPLTVGSTARAAMQSFALLGSIAWCASLAHHARAPLPSAFRQ